MPNHKNAFTLIEVMISVVIISVVIMAMLEMYSNNTHIFRLLKDQVKMNSYTSFIIASEIDGFKNKNLVMYDFIDDFDIEHTLKRELKNIKVEVLYKELSSIDFSDDNEENGGTASPNIVFELGETIIKVDATSSKLLRLRRN